MKIASMLSVVLLAGISDRPRIRGYEEQSLGMTLPKIVQCDVMCYDFYMGWRQITVALLTVTAAGAAATFAIDLGKYAFAMWH
jgi:hypothetical protein